MNNEEYLAYLRKAHERLERRVALTFPDGQPRPGSPLALALVRNEQQQAAVERRIRRGEECYYDV